MPNKIIKLPWPSGLAIRSKGATDMRTPTTGVYSSTVQWSLSSSTVITCNYFWYLLAIYHIWRHLISETFKFTATYVSLNITHPLCIKYSDLIGFGHKSPHNKSPIAFATFDPVLIECLQTLHMHMTSSPHFHMVMWLKASALIGWTAWMTRGMGEPPGKIDKPQKDLLI